MCSFLRCSVRSSPVRLNRFLRTSRVPECATCSLMSDRGPQTLVLNRMRVFANTCRQARCSARVRLSRLNEAVRAADAGPMQIECREGLASGCAGTVERSTVDQTRLSEAGGRGANRALRRCPGRYRQGLRHRRFTLPSRPSRRSLHRHCHDLLCAISSHAPRLYLP